MTNLEALRNPQMLVKQKCCRFGHSILLFMRDLGYLPDALGMLQKYPGGPKKRVLIGKQQICKKSLVTLASNSILPVWSIELTRIEVKEQQYGS
jgi:hypothetical protein